MPRKPIDIRPSDYPISQKRGLLHPFPAFRRGRVRAEPANGSRDWSLVRFGATPQGLKSPISAIFKVRSSLFFSAQFFHRLLDTTYKDVFVSSFPSLSIFCYGTAFLHRQGFLDRIVVFPTKCKHLPTADSGIKKQQSIDSSRIFVLSILFVNSHCFLNEKLFFLYGKN